MGAPGLPSCPHWALESTPVPSHHPNAHCSCSHLRATPQPLLCPWLPKAPRQQLTQRNRLSAGGEPNHSRTIPDLIAPLPSICVFKKAEKSFFVCLDRCLQASSQQHMSMGPSRFPLLPHPSPYCMSCSFHFTAGLCRLSLSSHALCTVTILHLMQKTRGEISFLLHAVGESFTAAS